MIEARSSFLCDRVETDRETLTAEIGLPFQHPQMDKGVTCGVHWAHGSDDGPFAPSPPGPAPPEPAQAYLELVSFGGTGLRLTMDARAVASLIRRLSEAQAIILRSAKKGHQQ